MTISADQKVQAINYCVEALKVRLDNRRTASQRNLEKISSLAEAEKPLHLAEGQRVAKSHKLGEPISCEHGNTRIGDGYKNCLQINGKDYELYVPLSNLPKLIAHANAEKALGTLKHELCREIEFLSGLLRPAMTSRFGTYAGSRLALGKDEVATDAKLRPLLEDFIQSCRPAVCAIK